MPERLFHYQTLFRSTSYFSPFRREIEAITARQLQRSMGLSSALSSSNRPQREGTSRGTPRGMALMSEAERTLRAHEFMSNPTKLAAALAENEKDHYAAISDQYRVYCLTERPDSPLMWAHYASSHTGICLEFDTRKAPFTEAFPPFTGGLLKVKYRSTYPAYDIVSGGYPALFTKSEDWSYEAEWRLIAEERRFARSFWTLKTNNDFLTLAPGVLTSVTIGCLADEPSRQRIEDIVISNAPGVLVRQATLAPDRYELRINPPFR